MSVLFCRVSNVIIVQIGYFSPDDGLFIKDSFASHGPHKGKSFLTKYIAFETNRINEHSSVLRIE